MKHFSVLIKPASSLCNMRCRYCFYEDISSIRTVKTHGIMSPQTSRILIENIYKNLQDGDLVSFAFQGGEPTLAGIGFFRDFVETVSWQKTKARVSYSIQTNGLLLDKEWCLFLRDNKFLVGLSLDGGRDFHDTNRINNNEKGTYDDVMAAKNLLDKAGVQYNILCVLTQDIARYPLKIWNFILRENIRHIQFIPCLGSFGNQNSPWALTPKRFSRFYTELYKLWEAEVQNSNYISIKLFDDVVNLFVRKQVSACGMLGRCRMQYVVEADGSVYPCDFYVLDKYKIGNINNSTIEEMASSKIALEFLQSRPFPPPQCAECKYTKYCGGGCKRMESEMYLDKNGMCGFQSFLDNCLERLCLTGRILLGY